MICLKLGVSVVILTLKSKYILNLRQFELISQLRKQYYWKNISLTLNSKAICKIFNIQTYRNVSNPWSPWTRPNERIDANKIFPTNQVNLDLFSSNGNLMKINVADQESNVTMVSFILSFSIYLLFSIDKVCTKKK